MRLADVVLRRGHLSENSLVEVWNTGVRPAHLDRCDICAERAIEMSRWLEDVQAIGVADADAAFSEQRLTAQRGQVMARLNQLDQPARVISFPAGPNRLAADVGLRRISPGWMAAAAAVGLMIGVISGELSHALFSNTHTVPQVVAVQPPVASSAIDAAALYDDPYGSTELGSLSAMDEMTPRLVEVVAAIAIR